MEHEDENMSGSASSSGTVYLEDLEDLDEMDVSSGCSSFSPSLFGNPKDIRDTNFSYACLKACGLIEKKKEDFKMLLEYTGGLSTKMYHQDYFTPKYKFVVTGFNANTSISPMTDEKEEKLLSESSEDFKVRCLQQKADYHGEVIAENPFIVLPKLPYEMVFQLYFDLAYMPKTFFDRVIQFCYEEKEEHDLEELYDDVDEYIVKYYKCDKHKGFKDADMQVIEEENLITEDIKPISSILSKNNDYELALQNIGKTVDDLPHQICSRF